MGNSPGRIRTAFGAGAIFVAACSWSVTVAPDERNPTLEALIEENNTLSTEISRQEELLLYLATRVSAPFVTPRSSLEPTPAVYGNVAIEDGACCVGGQAGSTLEVRVTFYATSPFAEVTEMRVRVGAQSFDEAEMAEAQWEPFVPGRIYPVTVPLNWTGFYVTAQFRDALGNPSAIAMDDISVEGFPSTGTPLPIP